MLSHEQIWKAIDRLADAHGYSTSGLAKRAGLDPTTFNRSKRFSNDGKERWPSTESVAKVLAVTQASPAEFIALINDANVDRAGPPRYTPLIPFSLATEETHFDDRGRPVGPGWDDLQFPDAGTTPLYAIDIDTNDGAPFYRKGDRILVAPGEPCRRGDRVVVRTRDGKLHLGEIARQTATRIDLTPVQNGTKDREWGTSDILWIARIIWASQ